MRGGCKHGAVQAATQLQDSFGDLPSGNYFVEVTVANQKQIRKVVVE